MTNDDLLGRKNKMIIFHQKLINFLVGIYNRDITTYILELIGFLLLSKFLLRINYIRFYFQCFIRTLFCFVEIYIFNN